jgi:hypothetical protein
MMVALFITARLPYFETMKISRRIILVSQIAISDSPLSVAARNGV